MKTKILKGIILTSIMVILIACNAKKEEKVTVDKDQIKAELQAMETAYADAFNAGKPDDIVYYADDATSFSQNMPPLMGKEAIYTSIKNDISGFTKGHKVSFTVKEVFPSNDGEQVVEIGSYKVVDSTVAVVRSGNYISLFVKKDGKYLCIRDMGASDMPKEEEKETKKQ
ncbi:nuclear transport factor 2 family protein [Flavobacterium silvisoli]|uniref:Nuclear transport factor 2 family protein n=1 Tax=Flavobacterium silvisoli TaxID=2529433 RepID=A0A4Q9YY31_9FLAO|nr:nuclear transport factor 2 family protein [Flavobacterium silvisoli]TBX68750.1 nuclear transport factor 2 family protein [Flavobacterium silvisoli]